MKVTAWVAAVSLALGGLLAGCGEQGAGNSASSGGSSASKSTPSSPSGSMGGSSSSSANQDASKRPGSSSTK